MKRLVKYILITYVFFLILYGLSNYLPLTKAKYSSNIPDTLVLTIAKPKYNITFDANGGTGTMSDMTNLKYGTTYTLTSNAFTNSPYVFAGWNTKDDGTGRSYSNGAQISNLSSTDGTTITLYAVWTTGVAEMDGVSYNSIKAAIDAAPTDGTPKTIYVLQDTTEAQLDNGGILPGHNITINLQNHTVRNKNTGPIFTNNGTLKIMNGSVITQSIGNNTTAVQGAINNKGATASLILENVTVESLGPYTKQALYNESGTVIVQGTSYIHNSNDTNNSNMKRPAIETKTGGTLTIKEGVTVQSDYNSGIKVDGSNLVIGTKDGTVSTTSPSIQGAIVGVEMTGSQTVKFYDGVVKGVTNAFTNNQGLNDVELSHELDLSSETIGTDTYEVATLQPSAITSFEVTFNPMGGVVNETSRTVQDGSPVGTLPTPTKSGYTFDGWLDSNDNPVSATDLVTANITYYAHWTHINGYVCNVMVGEQEFTNIADAVNAAPNGSTLVMTDDITTKFEIPSGKELTIDLGTHTMSNSVAKDPIINNLGTLTIKNGYMTPSSTAAAAAVNNKGIVTIDGTTIITTGVKQAVYNDGGTMIITGNSYFESSSVDRATVTNNAGTIRIESGTIVSTAFAAVAITNGTVTIGSQGGTIDTTSPIIMGATYAVDNSKGKTFNYYDGILKRQGTSGNLVNGNITNQEANTHIVNGTENIDGVDYITGVLEAD